MANRSSAEEGSTGTSPPSSPPDVQPLPAVSNSPDTEIVPFTGAPPASHQSGPGTGAILGTVTGGEVVAPGLLIGESHASRKRGSESDPLLCSVCGKGFVTAKAMFGHMRSHRDRGWRGARPPPAFRADEEFADLRHFLQQQQQDTDTLPSQAPDPVPAPDGEEEPEGEGEEYGPGAGAGGRCIPDLNLPLRRRD